MNDIELLQKKLQREIKARQRLEKIVETRTQELFNLTEQLEEDRDLAQKYIDIAGTMMIALDRNMKISMVNRKTCDVLEYNKKELIGKNWLEMCIPSDRKDFVKNVFDRIVSKEIEHFRNAENLVFTKSGEIRTILWHNTFMMDENNKVDTILSSGIDITEKKRMEQILADNEKKYRRIFENSTDAIYISNIDGLLIDCNQAFLDMFSFNMEEMEGINLSELYVNPDERNDLVMYLLTNDEVKNHEELLKKKDGTEMTCLVSVSRNWQEGEGTYLYQGIIRDITALKQREESLISTVDNLQQKSAEMQGLLSAGQSILKKPKFIDAARIIFNECKNLIGAASGYVALLSESGDKNEVLFLDSGGLPCTVDENLPIPIRGLREKAYREKRTVYDNDFMNSPWVKFMPEGHVRLNNVLFTPLIINNKAVGLLGFANKKDDFTDINAQVADAFGELAAIALKSSRTLDLLKESEMRYRHLFENAGDGILIADPFSRKLISANKTMCAMLGYSQAEITKLGVQDIYPPEKIDDIVAIFDKQVKGDIQFTPNIPLMKKDGTVFFADFNARIMVLDGELRLVGIVRDNTEQIKLNEQKEKLQQMETLKKMIATLNHEMNQPLSVILSQASVLMSECKNNSQHHEDMNMIVNAGNRLNEIIKKISTLKDLNAIDYSSNSKMYDINSGSADYD